MTNTKYSTTLSQQRLPVLESCRIGLYYNFGFYVILTKLYQSQIKSLLYSLFKVQAVSLVEKRVVFNTCTIKILILQR